MITAALVLLLAAGTGATVPPVQVGLEAVEAQGGGPLRGRKVGLLAHAASVTADGRRAAQVLRRCGVDLRVFFAPEHGLDSQAAAGEALPDGTDPASGLRVVSLYGPRTAPAAEDLRGLDALVVDLQDAGVRFYSYESTLIASLEAAGASGIELVVLDRPNPLGGDLVEGPEAESPARYQGRVPGPLVHGLTLGELARYVNASLPRPARLTVVPLQGWTRAMRWADTGRAWIPASPSLRTAEAALAYPGLALLEATNVSEGRGTETPFLLLGAPWLEAATASIVAPGFALSPATFTPRASRAVPDPKYRDQECRGLRVSVADAARSDPYRLGLTLLAALRRDPGFRWLDGGATLDRLLGTSSVRRAFERGVTVDQILGAEATGVTRFRHLRERALLY